MCTCCANRRLRQLLFDRWKPYPPACWSIETAAIDIFVYPISLLPPPPDDCSNHTCVQHLVKFLTVILTNYFLFLSIYTYRATASACLTVAREERAAANLPVAREERAAANPPNPLVVREERAAANPPNPLVVREERAVVNPPVREERAVTVDR